MKKASITWLPLLSALLAPCPCVLARHEDTSQADWDYLIFTQHWPITVCQEWMDVEKSHTCSFPTPQQTWTIHGVWPTKDGSMGPQYCNRTWNFDLDQVKSIEPALNQMWINIEKETSTDSLWAHEWSKHGTCAAALPALGSELHYFGQGLRWKRAYDMNAILAAADVYPHKERRYRLEDIYGAIKNKLAVKPIVECRHERGYNYIFELRICFDKQLVLRDCGEIAHLDSVDIGGDVVQTNCPLGEGILYPPTVMDAQRTPPRATLVQLYKLLSWLQWLTL